MTDAESGSRAARRLRRAPLVRALGMAWIGLAGTGTAWAGPALTLAAERDARLAAGRADDALAATEAPAGVTLAGEASHGGIAPQFTVGPFGMRGGLHLQTGNLAGPGPGRLRLGIAWREGPGRKPGFEGTSFTWRPAQDAPDEFYASVQRRHWGPGWTGSLILDGAAPAIPALGWRRTTTRSPDPWLSRIGPWGADVFVGRLQGHRNAARPQVIGMRIVFAPIDDLELGLARMLQWGGRGRDESSSSLLDALLGNDNVGFGGITSDSEPGNQLAGLDLRWIVDRDASTSVYAQMVGEDEAGKFPSRNMLLVGLDTRLDSTRGALRLFVEGADTLAGRVSNDRRPGVAYRHSGYERGYTQEGVLLGHPAGGDVKLGSVGLLFRDEGLVAMLTASLGKAEPSAQRFAAGRLFGFGASGQWQWVPGWQLGAAAAAWQDRAGRRASMQVWVRFAP